VVNPLIWCKQSRGYIAKHHKETCRLWDKLHLETTRAIERTRREQMEEEQCQSHAPQIYGKTEYTDYSSSPISTSAITWTILNASLYVYPQHKNRVLWIESEKKALQIQLKMQLRTWRARIFRFPVPRMSTDYNCLQTKGLLDFSVILSRESRTTITDLVTHHRWFIVVQRTA